MDVRARAGIDIYGTVLRYAEVEQRGPRYRLLRLGSCDFDFDIAEAVLQGNPPGFFKFLVKRAFNINTRTTQAYLPLIRKSGASNFAYCRVKITIGKHQGGILAAEL